MKNFIKQNWYKLMLSSSILMASFGFMVYSISSVFATNEASALNRQFNSSIPVNEDGSITIRLTNEQLKLIMPPSIQPVNLVQLKNQEIMRSKRDSRSELFSEGSAMLKVDSK